MSGPWYKPSLREVRPGHEPTSPHPAWGRRPPTNAETCCWGALCPAPGCHHKDPKQGPSPELAGGDKAKRFSQVLDLPSNLDTSFSEPAPPLEERVATASTRATHGVHPPVSSPWSHASEQLWRSAPGLPHEGTASSFSDGQRTRGLQALPTWPEQRACGPPRTPSPPACQDSDHVHWGEGGSRGQRSHSQHTEGPRPHGRACTRTARGAELDLRQDWRPGKPVVAGPPTPPPKRKVTRAGAAALTFCSCLGYS